MDSIQLLRKSVKNQDSAQGPLAFRLRQARLEKGLSQKELGIQAGIDEFVASTRMNRYERGIHMPEYPVLKNIAAVLKTPVPWFYCEDEALAKLILEYAIANEHR